MLKFLFITFSWMFCLFFPTFYINFGVKMSKTSYTDTSCSSSWDGDYLKIWCVLCLFTMLQSYKVIYVRRPEYYNVSLFMKYSKIKEVCLQIFYKGILVNVLCAILVVFMVVVDPKKRGVWQYIYWPLVFLVIFWIHTPRFSRNKLAPNYI